MDKLTIKHDVRQHGSFVDYPPEDFYSLRHSSPDIFYSLDVVNYPRNGAGHLYNCGACAVALDLRLKGYDVVARLKPDGTNVGDLAEYYENGKYYQPFSTEYPDYLLHSWRRYAGHCEQVRAIRRRIGHVSGTRAYRKMQSAYCNYCSSFVAEQKIVVDKLTQLVESNIYGSCGIIILGFACSDDPYKHTTMFHAINYCGGVFYDAQEGCVINLSKLDFDPREVYVLPTEGLKPKASIVELVVSR